MQFGSGTSTQSDEQIIPNPKQPRKFFSDKSNWLVENSVLVEKNNQIEDKSKKTLSANI